MAETRLKVVLETTGQGKLKAARKDSDQLAKALGRVGVQSKSAANGIRLTGRAASGASRGVKSLSSALGQVAIAFASITTAAALFNTTINREESERRIKLVAGAYGEAAQLADAAGRAAKKFGLGQTEANLAIADTFARLKPLGTSLKDIESVYSGFNTAVKLSGVTAEEAQSAFRQLNQALGSGVLRGDEFTRISEAIPSILITIADELDVTIGELKKLGSEGLLTSDVVVRALKRVEKEGADKVAESLKGPRQQLINLQNAGEDLAAELGKFLLPAFIDLVQKSTELVKELNKVADAMNRLPQPVKDTAAAFVLLGGAIAGISLVGGAFGGLAGISGAVTGLGNAAKGAVAQVAKLGGGAKTVATGWTAAGGAITKTTTAVTAATVALGALQAALAIGTVVAWGKILFDINAEIRETNRLLKGGTEVLDDLEKKIQETKDAIKEASRETGFWEGILNEFILGVGNADGALTGLNKRLDEFIQKRNTLRSQAAFDSRDNQKDANREGFNMDEVNRILAEGKPKPTGGGGGSGSKAPKAKEDPIPGLTRQLDLSDKLLANQRAILEAKFNENDELLKTLQLRRVQIELDGKIAEINAEDISDKAKGLKTALAINEALEQRAEIQADARTKERDLRREADQILEGLRAEGALLDAKLAGKEEEFLINERINKILKENKLLEEGEVRAIVEGNKEKEKALKKLKEEQAFNKQVIETIGNSLEDALVKTLEVAILKTEDLGDALKQIASQLLLSLGRQFLSRGIGQAQSALFPSLFPMAEGGYVTGPTPALVGEGGEPEYVIPASQMSEAMGRYAAGTRGEAVIDGPSSPGGGGLAVADAPTTVNISGGVMQIGDDQYIRKDQIPSIINQASKAGETRALRKLQMSPTARRRTGI